MKNNELSNLISDIKPAKNDMFASLIVTLIFGFILIISLFEILGKYSETAAIVSFGFTALHVGRFVEIIRFSRKIKSVLEDKELY